eukprot:COSAG02_NODE_31742_length_528_cov_0.836830_2_plen_37_part_01
MICPLIDQDPLKETTERTCLKTRGFGLEAWTGKGSS